MRSETARKMVGGVSFPLLNDCCVYLVGTLNHCGPAQLEGHRKTTPVCVCVQRYTEKRTYFYYFLGCSIK